MYTIESQSAKGSAKKDGKLGHELTGGMSMMDLGDIEDLSDEDAVLDA